MPAATLEKTEPGKIVIRYRPYGAAADVFQRQDDELLICGPAGTGKSRACLEKVHLAALRHPGMRGLIARKTRADLAGSALVTFEKKVLHPGDYVKYTGAHGNHPANYRYPNGSTLVVGGLDRDSSNIMSAEYDLIYVQQAEDLVKSEWESATSRLRYGVMPYQQLLGDANPNAPTHWLKGRCDEGVTTMLYARHQDNPELWDHATNDWTEFGRTYMRRLNNLTGVTRLRLRDGLWAAAEGIVYENWNPAIHVIPRFQIPSDWPRYWSVDFGNTNPFVWQEWAEDGDGRLYLHREIYHAKRLVIDHARMIKALTKDGPRPRGVVADHDGDGRGVLERELGIATIAANKPVQEGIQAVTERLRPAEDGRPRLFIMEGALHERDQALAEAMKPTSTVSEFEVYIWDTSNGRKHGEEPKKENDHGMDAMRYMVMSRDRSKEPRVRLI